MERLAVRKQSKSAKHEDEIHERKDLEDAVGKRHSYKDDQYKCHYNQRSKHQLDSFAGLCAAAGFLIIDTSKHCLLSSSS